jgi:hypothetical protein
MAGLSPSGMVESLSIKRKSGDLGQGLTVDGTILVVIRGDISRMHFGDGALTNIQ